jgi:hypothetical protein
VTVSESVERRKSSLDTENRAARLAYRRSSAVGHGLLAAMSLRAGV